MELLDGSEPFLHWDRNLSELSEAGDIDRVLYTNQKLVAPALSCRNEIHERSGPDGGRGGVTSSDVPPLPGPLKFRPLVIEGKSRNLLSTFEDEQPHLLGLGGEYPDQWEETTAVVMAAWRRSEQQKAPEEPGAAETHPPFRNAGNDTQTSKNLLLELHRSLEQRTTDSSSKVLVNETS
ncbi:Cyclic AMP-responsive element-binding protein 3-like protein 2 [Liparis tanakae]|uniref:Cyclic AMP-responsive element-binding protein 3-like protein 2 n=1 Tax=Liparis tanakae TaxID=230148 RepID=A0A4Z2GBK3_9TELE|nr:Cyclic AMP-responsive element-binding protein 3-like protein 2 [Liparis tanakae]